MMRSAASPAAFAAGIGCVLYIFLSWWRLRQSVKTLHLEFFPVHTGIRGEKNILRLRVVRRMKANRPAARRPFPMPDVTLRVTVRNRMTGECQQVTDRGRIVRSMMAECPIRPEHAGIYEIEDASWIVRDPTGWIRTKRRVIEAADHPPVLCVLPPEGQARIDAAEIVTYDMESDRYAPDRSGTDPSEVFDIRTYQPGDSLKQIHWKLSAKSGELMYREPSYPVDTRLLLLIDKCVPLTPDDMERAEAFWGALSRELRHQELPYTVGWIHPEDGTLELSDARDGETLCEMVWRSLSIPYRASAASTAACFRASVPETRWNRIIYITPDPLDAGLLEEYGEVLVRWPDTEN